MPPGKAPEWHRAAVSPRESGHEVKLPESLSGFSKVLVKSCACDKHCACQPGPTECSVVEGTTVRHASVPLSFGDGPIPPTLLVRGSEPVRASHAPQSASPCRIAARRRRCIISAIGLE